MFRRYANKLLIPLLLVSCFVALTFGSVAVTFADFATLCKAYIFNANLSDPHLQRVYSIIFDIRLPRLLMAIAAGGSLALAGALLQRSTLNPLADPFLFGVASGASFGAVCVMAIFPSLALATGASTGLLVSFSLPAAAFIGSAMSMLLVLSLASRYVQQQVEQLLLAGVATAFLFSALTSLVLYFSSTQTTAGMVFWSLGSLANVEWQQLPAPWLALCCGLLVSISMQPALLALQTGDESAHSLGVSVVKVRLLCLLTATVLTSCVVAFCGGIGFVGLMIPHIMQFIDRRNTRFTLLHVAVAGSIFLIWVDLIARSALPVQELPIGVITSVCGSLFFLILMKWRTRRTQTVTT